MTDVLLEDAIRAGVARGMDDAPVVPDLAERVRALPSAPRPRWPLLAAAASVAGLVLAGGLLAIHHTTHSGNASLPNGSSSSNQVRVPPYPTTSVTNDEATASRATGAWDPLWIAGYDGPAPAAPLTVTAPPTGPGRSGAALIRPALRVAPMCDISTLRGSLTPSGELVGRQTSRFGLLCTVIGGYVDSGANAWGAAYGRFTRLSVTSDKASMTLYDGDAPVAQLVRRSESDVGKAAPPNVLWSISGQLPRAVTGQWDLQYSGLPVHNATITFDPDGTLTGFGPCDAISGRYRVGVDGSASFPAYKLKNHSCPAGTKPTWRPPSTVAKVGVYGDLLTFYDAKGRALAIFKTGARFHDIVVPPPADLTAAGAVGNWVPVQVAGYDGPVWPTVFSVIRDANKSGATAGYRLAVTPTCGSLGMAGTLGKAGDVHARTTFGSPASCPARPVWAGINTAAFGGALETFTRISLSPDGKTLTLSDGTRALAWLRRSTATQGSPQSQRWSVSGSLPAAAHGTWRFLGGPNDGSHAVVTLTPDGRLAGSGPCDDISGTYTLDVSGNVTFDGFNLSPRACTSAGTHTWQPSAGVARIGILGDTLTIYDSHNAPLGTFLAVPGGTSSAVGG